MPTVARRRTPAAHANRLLAGSRSRKQFLGDCLRFVTSAAAAMIAAPLMACRPRNAADVALGTPAHAGAGEAAVDPAFVPGYLRLHRAGELRRRGEQLRAMMTAAWSLGHLASTPL